MKLLVVCVCVLKIKCEKDWRQKMKINSNVSAWLSDFIFHHSREAQYNISYPTRTCWKYNVDIGLTINQISNIIYINFVFGLVYNSILLLQSGLKINNEIIGIII